MKPRGYLLLLALVGAAGCAQIAGFEDDYVIGDVGVGGSSTGTPSGTAGSGGTSATGVATGGEGQAGQGGALGEDCLDGIDNDDNQLVDCEDPACQSGHECVPAVPAGWLGIYRVATAAYPDASPACPNGADGEIYYDGAGDPASCTACSCGAVQNATCSLPQMLCYEDSSSCSGTPDVTSPADTSCHDFPYGFLCTGGCSSPQKCELASLGAITGSPSCPASGGVPTLPDRWQYQHDACRYTELGGGCGPGQACVAMDAAPYDQPACILQAGTTSCPSGWPTTIDAFGDATDTRDCSPCSCQTSGLSCSGGKATIFDNDSCGGGTMEVSGSSCHEIGNYSDDKNGSYRLTAATVSGSCTPAGGQPTGNVVPSDPTTICCLAPR